MGAIHKLHPYNAAPLEMRQSSLCYQDFLQLQSPVPHWTRITIFGQKSEVKFDYTTKQARSQFTPDASVQTFLDLYNCGDLTFPVQIYHN